MPPIFLNPLTDSRYEQFVATHPDATVFHTPAWIRVLYETYGFKPGCVAIVDGDEIRGALPYMETRSITGKRRCVALPFSDFCEPLFESNSDFINAFDALATAAKKLKWSYVELRGGECFLSAQPHAGRIAVHEINLLPDENTLYNNLRDSLKRNIRKAEKAGLSVSFETSEQTMKEFVRLNNITRKQHGLPPQPSIFFKNLFKHLLSQNVGFVVTVAENTKTIAAGIFLFKGKKAFFKFGASDHEYLHLRPNDLMFRQAINHCKELGKASLNLGRTELQHSGLLQFKRGWRGKEVEKQYFRYSVSSASYTGNSFRSNPSLCSIIFRTMPVFMLRWTSGIFYRFAG